MPAMTATTKALLQLGSVLVLLAAAGVLATRTNTLSGTQVFAMIMVIGGGTAVAGGLALAAPTTTVLPHLVLIAAVVGLTVAMAVTHVFGPTDVTGVFALILGSGALGAGSSISATTTPDPPVADPPVAPVVPPSLP